MVPVQDWCGDQRSGEGALSHAETGTPYGYQYYIVHIYIWKFDQPIVYVCTT